MRSTATMQLAVALTLASGVAAAEDTPALKVVAVMGFDANPAASAQAPAVESLVASHLADRKDVKVITQSDVNTLLGVERQRELMGNREDCTESSCMTELAGAVGARYVMNGRVDLFGEQYVITASLFDANAAKILVKARREATTDAAIPAAAKGLAADLLTGLMEGAGAATAAAGTGTQDTTAPGSAGPGTPGTGTTASGTAAGATTGSATSGAATAAGGAPSSSQSATASGASTGTSAAQTSTSGTPDASVSAQSAAGNQKFSLGLRVGNTLLANITAFNLSGDVDFGWRFDPEWVAFIQVGVALVTQEGDDLPSTFALVPSVLGVRKLYRVEHSFQPYWGLGLGVQLQLGEFAIFRRTGPLPAVIGIVGFQYMITPRFGLGLEGSINLAQTVLGITQDARGSGFNLDLNGALTWRF